MTQHSSIDLEASEGTTPDVPLSERPLVSDDQNTVVSSSHAENWQAGSAVSTPAGQELLDRLFASSNSDQGLEQGLRLGHFEVRERIASGGMGAVFLATDLDLSRDVALKILHPGTARDPSLIARFRNEARACARLNHDNVARVYFTGQQDGIHFIAYEFANGRTIKDLIQQRGMLTSSETVNYAIQATLALNHIFSAGIVHRDIKPSNIILTEAGRVKVVDLGLARRESQDSIGDITVAGTTLGTFDYISPEQARDPRTADIRSDIYSLGCTMYHMLTGQPPYPEGTALQKLLDHQGKTPPDPTKLNRSIEPELAATVQKMMSTNPDDRYQDPGQLLADLMELASLMGLRSVPAEGIVWQRIEAPSIRQVSGAVFLFGSVMMICSAALIMHFTPQPVADDDQLLDRQSIGTLTSSVDIDDEVPVATGDGPTTGGDTDGSRGVPIPPDRTAAAETAAGNGDATRTGNNPRNDSSASGSQVADSSLRTNGNGSSGTNANGSSLSSQQNSTQDTATVTPDKPRNTADTTTAAPAAADDSLPFVVTSISDGVARQYDSLSQALADARSEDTIRLQFDGIRRIPRDSLDRINGKILTLAGGSGYQPVLEFDPPADPDTPNAGIFRLINNSSLRIEDVQLRLGRDDMSSGDQWAMFDCDGPNQVVLRNVAIDIAARDQPRTAIFRLNDSDASADGNNQTMLELTAVVVRGAADLIYGESQSDGRVRISDCGFALNGSLLKSLGSASMNHSQGNLQLQLTHVSCLLTEPLIQMQDSDTLTGNGPQRILPTVSVHSDACVFASLGGGGTLVRSLGNTYVVSLEELLSWDGSTNLYHGIDAFWVLESSETELSMAPYDFSEWQAHWTQRSDGGEESSIQFTWSEASWAHQDGNVDLTQMTTDWLRLDKALFHGSNPQRPRYQTYEIPGVAPEQLPEFATTEPAAEASPATADAGSR